MNVYLVKLLFSKISTSPQSPPCKGRKTGVVVLVADMLRYEFYPLIRKRGRRKTSSKFLQTLARETRMPAEVVSSLYESVFDRLKNHAKIKDFLPILVSREVKDILLHKINLSLTEYRDDYL